MNLYFIRHTSVRVDKGVCYGQFDVELNPTFIEEATIVKKNVDQIPIDYVYSSPLSRCHKLARFVTQQNIELEDDIKELNFGEWEMKRWEDVDSVAWGNDWVNTQVPGGESFKMMYNRVKQFIEGLKKHSTTHKNIAIFTHGGVCACAMVYFENLLLENAFDKKVNYGDIIHYTL